MPRRPEIGNIQLYPDRPLKKTDRNGFVLKFYCPIRGTRVRKNCGTRDRREARRILRECQQRLLDGSYVASGGAITAEHEVDTKPAPTQASFPQSIRTESDRGPTWEECYQKYRSYKSLRVRKKSFEHSASRLGVAERIFLGYMADHGIEGEVMVQDVMTLDMLEYLQERLLEGDESRYDHRSPNTVNSSMGAVMAFVRFCAKRDWIVKVPDLDSLSVDDVMKGRPITGEELDRMIEAIPRVVGKNEAPSWQFALRVLWYSGFRVGDLMDFHWEDERHIRPVWSSRSGVHPTITVPSSQKNGKLQEIPMLPELEAFLLEVPKAKRAGWIVNPLAITSTVKPGCKWFQPAPDDLVSLANQYSNLSIAEVCGVSETTVRKWLKKQGHRRSREFKVDTGTIPESVVIAVQNRSKRQTGAVRVPDTERLTKERVGRIIAAIGEEAGIVVRQEDERTGTRTKFASAHDIRRGCAQRLINAGVSAETLKVVMRHADFATTEKYYGAMRSAQAAANEVRQKLTPDATSDALVGGLMGGHEKTPQLSTAELSKLKRLLNSI
ncbi:site-specific integrase [Stieleria sp. TO1_6]|uniref:tyrosine-type recombinase/integrase n=2 Tax=Pirellulaceae TaxID=2691357 RepID=UPI00209B7984|nr:site-specific integrase [Stieleria tagensis]MCO8124756.1 site-specific integrase [Stieleria tagensis]